MDPATKLRSSEMSYEEITELDPAAFELSPSSVVWLRWHAETSGSGVAPGSFSLRGGGNIQPIDLSIGTCFDWPTSRIGWMASDGTSAPRRIWSQTRSKLPPQPAPLNGQPWKKAFWAQLCVFVDGTPIRAIWETSQLASWLAYRDLMVAIAQQGPRELPKLPLVAHTGIGLNRKPTLTLGRFVERPACLPQDPSETDSDTDTGSTGIAWTQPHAGGPKWDSASDEIPF
jgi:hypothetical protein